jgi:pimeloyl-ACP methyl ester carboxylesterase
MWIPVIEKLKASYRCYCIDTITDANKSVLTRRLRGVEDHVVWMREVFAALDIQSARVVGLSYGGWLATVLSVHAADLVERLVMLCPAGTFTRITPAFMARMVGASVMKSPALARRSIQWLSSTPDAHSDQVLGLVATILIVCRPTMMPPTAFTDAELRSIRAPTTAVIGDREVIYRGGPQAALDRARRLIPDVRTRLVHGGHVLTVDCPKELADEVLTALA